ncbi:unnamed protein product [Mytilus coruscus]|uniref:Reverse transcriptase domain-containing protein n=1 Tax=Mytilus coruscus TaxID=42192 RepID=A0A6J7ZXB9_MYTCO|nr:unnamed protein product [Mytilus coruscus]
MDNPINEMFHRLIRRNRGNRNKDSMCIMENGELQYSPVDQTQSFSKYFEDLALPKDKGYDPEFLDLCNVWHKTIEQLCEQENLTTEFSTQNICDAIKQLHFGKATDKLGLAAEHFKNSPAIVTQFLTDCFNTIMKDKLIPHIFKSGIVIPVLKKGKNPMMMDNYRGIAVTPVVSKLCECTILPSLTQNFKQSTLQFGFTKGMSMLMAGLIISEARAEVKHRTIEPLYLITVDSQKAFDVVDRIIMLDELHEHKQNHSMWTIVKKLIQWSSLKGVRQGGILSPFLYKVYVNNLREDLKSHSLGFKIGTTYVGCPTCANDVAFISNCEQELQCMLSVTNHHANQSRVTINSSKTKTVILNKPKSINRSDLQWTLGKNYIYPSEDTTHLGLIRAEIKENDVNIEARISIARRTLYSLMNTGLHGTNGLNPQTSYKIYQSYVIPRLLYGMEILPLNQKQMDIFSRFHKKNLRNFQSMPARTATGAVYLILGALTIEAEIHKRQLSFLYNIVSCDNSTILDLVDRQLIMNMDNQQSFFCKVAGTLAMYDLPSIDSLKQQPPSKLKWKSSVKMALQKYWTKFFLEEIESKTTLVHLDRTLLKIGSVHLVLTSLSSTISDVKKGAVKTRLLTGTYLFESNKHKFSGGKESSLCRLCGTSNEDITHFLLLCPALHQQRKALFCNLNLSDLYYWHVRMDCKI